MAEGQVRLYMGEMHRIGEEGQLHQQPRVTVCGKYEIIWKSLLCAFAMCIVVIAIPVPVALHLQKVDLKCLNHFATEETTGIISKCLYGGIEVEFNDVNNNKLFTCAFHADVPDCKNGTSILFYTSRNIYETLVCSIDHQTIGREDCSSTLLFCVLYFGIAGTMTMIVGSAYIYHKISAVCVF